MLFLGDRRVDYPTSDGEPLGGTDPHRQQILDLIETLQGHFAANPDVYVSGNLLLCFNSESEPPA